jgi:3'-phosphoadenosine 5'-phosphosulfate sulfotransferase (PAPS reductase)/FAD synthetase
MSEISGTLFTPADLPPTPADLSRSAIRIHSPVVAAFILFSGGHDSLVSTHLSVRELRQLAPELPLTVLHINTTIGIPQTRDFVRRVADHFAWPFREIYPPTSYRELVLKFGFPGPGFHSLPYSLLKERCIRQVTRESKRRPRDRVLFVTGIRRAESRRRMGTATPVRRIGAQVWVNPIFYFSTLDRESYMQAHDLPRNPVVELLCMSGECLCGAFARPNELQEILLWYPETAKGIYALQDEARAAGKHSRWGVPPPTRSPEDAPLLPLCWSCEAKMEAL